LSTREPPRTHENFPRKSRHLDACSDCGRCESPLNEVNAETIPGRAQWMETMKKALRPKPKRPPLLSEFGSLRLVEDVLTDLLDEAQAVAP
jgi:hypothetical protein